MRTSQIQSNLKKAQQLRITIKTSNKQVQNLLNYQKFKIQQSNVSKKAILCCGSHKSDIVKIQHQFKTTFDKLSFQDKVRTYLKTCENVLKCLKGQQQNLFENEQNEIDKFILFREGLFFTQWNRKTMTINRKNKQIIFQKNSVIIDLHDFLVRKSKSDRKQLVFEPIRNFQKNKQLRITSSHQKQFPQLFQLIQDLCDEAQLQKIREMLKVQVRNKMQSSKNSKRPSIQDSIKKVSYEVNNPQNQTLAIEAIKLQRINQEQNSMRTQLKDAQHVGLNQLITNNFIHNLQNFNDYRRVREGVYYSKQGGKVRKVYQFDGSQIKMGKLVDALFDQSKFYKWKPTLKAIMDPSTQNENKRKKTIYQLHHFPQSKIQQGYIYDRRHFIKGSNEYIVDTNHKQYVEQADSVLKAQLNYVVWQVRNNNQHHIELIVEAQIDHFLKQELNQTFTDQFLGQLSALFKYPQRKQNMTLKIPKNQTKRGFQTEQFGDDGLSQISKKNGFYQTEYFSVQSDQNNVSWIQKNEQEQAQKLFKNFQKNGVQHKQIEAEAHYKINLRRPPILGVMTQLNYRHIINPLPQQRIKKRVQVINGYHYHLGRDWIVKEDGNLKSINEEMIKNQNGVLAGIIKRIGTNILSGKGIMNTSLPVNVFSKQTFLETWCKSFSYAPLHLEQAAKTNNIEKKFKAAFLVMIGVAILNIQMQKPFNPILGQTYQGLVDGCPIYGEQISHHPPISAFFMKGRGYFIHGTRQPQIDIGIRSAIGIMHGLWHIAFHDSNPQKNKITITGTTGQIKGLVFGERLVRTIRNTLIYDQSNLIYCCINWGPGTLKGPLSKHQNTFEGKLLKIKSTSTFNFKQQKKRPGKNDIQNQLGTFHGKMTDKCYFNDELIFDFNKNSPCVVEQYTQALQSDCQFRKDRNLRRAESWQKAQDAKQQLEQLQRNDRKLRKEAEQRRKRH